MFCILRVCFRDPNSVFAQTPFLFQLEEQPASCITVHLYPKSLLPHPVRSKRPASGVPVITQMKESKNLIKGWSK